ncbi:DNA mismatch repair protein Mlh3 isoform 2-T2 [Discoglossus pictus]
MIRRLTEEVKCSLRSGVAISSVAQCVEELTLNGIDAQATCVAIRIDLETFKIQVVDNGSGLCEEDMERVGVRYLTSKCHSLRDLESLEFYGFRGEAIASIAEMSSIVEISSKNKNTIRTFTKLFQNGKSMQVQEAEVNRPSAGTTVTVCNLFYNMPVRKKCMDNMLEFERIRQRVEAISLVHPSISFSLKNDSAYSVILQLPKTKEVRSRFCQIYGLAKSQKLRDIQHTLKGFNMCGYISSEGHYNKTMQYLYVNNRFVLKTRLHKLIGFIIRKESVICRPKTVASKLNFSPGRNRSGPELHGIFVINIKCNFSEYDVCFEPAKTLIEFQDWNSVQLCIEEGVKAFLKREKLFLEPSKEDVAEFNETSSFNLSCTELVHVEEQDQQEVFQKACDHVIENYDMSNLKSKYVCRTNNFKIHQAKDSINDYNIDEIQKKSDNYKIRDEFGDQSSTTSCEKDAANDSDSTDIHCSILTKCEGLEKCNQECSEPLNLQVATCENSLPSNTIINETAEDVINCTPGRSESSLSPLHGPIVGETTSTVICSNNDSVNEQELNIDSTTFDLSCSGYLTHSTTKLNQDNTEGKSKVSKLFFRPGPVSAIDILESKLSSLDNISQSKKLGEVSPHKMNVVIINNPELNHGQINILPEQYKSSSRVPCNGTKSTNKSSTSTVSRKLCLFGQIGSLERFRRQYGNRKSLLSHPCSLKEASLPAYQNDSVDHPPNKVKEFLSNPENNLEGQTEKNVMSAAGHAKDSPLIIKDTVLTVSEYTNLKLNASNEQKMCSSLTSKLSKMKQNQKNSSFPEHAKPVELLHKVILPNVLPMGHDTMDNAAVSVIGLDGNSFSNLALLQTSEKQPVCIEGTPTNIGEVHVLNSSSEGIKSTATNPRHAKDNPSNSIQEASKIVLSSWLQYYEESLGRNVFINKKTGLSSYSAPMEERNTVCIKDITTMAVNIVCSNGFQYQCHPFRGELLVPFLPRPREERELTRQNRDNDDADSDSLQSLYSEWQNPVFARHPLVAVDVSSGQADTLAVKIHNILHPYRFTKEMIHSMKVLQQVDNKFIACLIDTSNEDRTKQSNDWRWRTKTDGNLLVLVDQHAAHERVRLEQLIADSYEPVQGSCGNRRLKTSVVSPPLELDVTEQQCRLLRAYRESIHDVGLSLSFPDSLTPRVLVGEVPLCFVEKEASETQRGRAPVAKSMVQEYLQEQVELLQETGAAHKIFPLTVLKVLASQACHGAVKFNDGLSLEECRHLVEALAGCQLPFQCAHGRPSVLPLADLCHLDMGEQVSSRPNLKRLKQHI